MRTIDKPGFPRWSKISVLVCAAGLGISWARAANADMAQQPQILAKHAFENPKVPYQGRLTLSRWNGTDVVTEDVAVSFLPPAHFRWERLKPDGSSEKIVISDGQMEKTWIPAKNKVIACKARKNIFPRALNDAEWELAQSNYQISLLGADQLCGRPVWKILLTPKENGKPHQQLWLDQQTGVVLENKRYHPNQDAMYLARFIHFEPQALLSKELFDIPAQANEKEVTGAHHFSFEELEKMTGRPSKLPRRLPAGYVFSSVDTFTVDGKSVDHARYTDGIGVLSIFETPQPVRASDNLMKRPLTLSSGKPVMFNFEKDALYYTLVSDISLELLQTIANSIQSAAPNK